MTFAEFRKAAERGQLPPVVLVHGPDVQSLDDALRAATRGLLKDSTAETFDREVLDGDGVEAEAIVNAAMTLPVVAATRLVAVRRCNELPAKAQALLSGYLRRPNPSTCLLLLSAVLLRGRSDKPWLTGAVPGAATVSVDPGQGPVLERWVRQRAREDGLTVSEEAVKLLVQLVGDDSLTLLGEVRKAAVAGGPDNTTVGRREVEAVIGEQRIGTVFDFTEAIVKGETGRALLILDGLLATEDWGRVFYMIVREMQAAEAVLIAQQRGQPIASLARVLARPPHTLKPLEASPLTGSPQLLARAMECCWRAEARLKSGGKQPGAELAALVAELCGMQARATDDMGGSGRPPSPPAPAPPRWSRGGDARSRV